MRRRRHNLLRWSAITLALAGVALHIASCYPLPYYTWMLSAPDENPRGVELSVYRGSFWYHDTEWIGIGRAPRAGWGRYAFVNEPPSVNAWRQNFRDIRDYNPWGTLVVVPLAWLFLPAVGLIGWSGLQRVRRANRRRRGACVQCGYSMTGNVSGCCPECGTVRA